VNKETQVVLITGLVFVVMTGIALYYVNGRIEARKAREQDIATIKQDIAKAESVIAKKEELEKELDSLERNLSHYITILPSPEVATKESLMRLVQEKCERSQFVLERFVLNDAKAAARGAKAPKKKKDGGGFQEIGLTLDANGTYEQFLRFLNSLERHESFLRVNTFRCEAEPKPRINEEDGTVSWPLTISLNLSTFRYEAGK
tara:strand:- start:3528 stop:4136 length:609 start_codon:yes stop_codon:yes gene_type:complete